MNAYENYRGLSASTYDLWFLDDKGFEARFFLKAAGPPPGPVLEAGCGTGRLMVPFLRAGYRIDGVDASGEMLALAQEKLAGEVWTPRLVCQPLEALDLPDRYAFVFVALGTIQLLASDAALLEAFRRVRTHLSPGGRFLFGTYIPADEIAKAPSIPWYVRRDVLRPDDGARVRCHERIEIDTSARVRTGHQRYTVERDGVLLAESRESFRLLWRRADEYAALLAEAGFAAVAMTEGYTQAAAAPDSALTFFHARAATV